MKWLVLIGIVYAGFADDALCPPGQTGFSGSCYQLLDMVMTWEAANETCTAMGGDLAEVKSLSENQFIWDMFRESDHKTLGVWIDCVRDEHDENRWVHHHGMECSYFNWFWAEPSVMFFQNENCVEIRRQYNGQWNDIDCLTENSVVCEHFAIQPIAPAMKCLQADATGRFAAKK